MPSSLIQPVGRGINIDRLNPQQQMFVEHLLGDETFNPTVAAKKAGYKAPGTANKLLNNPLVAAYIGKEIRKRKERLELNADDVLDHLRNVIFLDPLAVFEKQTNGKELTMKQLHKIPKKIRRCITKMKTRTKYDSEGNIDTVYFDIEFMSKDTAMGLVMKHLGLLNEKLLTEIDVGPALAQLIPQLRAKIEERSNVVDSDTIKRRLESGE